MKKVTIIRLSMAPFEIDGEALFSFVVGGAYLWSGSLIITGIFEIS